MMQLCRKLCIFCGIKIPTRNAYDFRARFLTHFCYVSGVALRCEVRGGGKGVVRKT